MTSWMEIGVSGSMLWEEEVPRSDVNGIVAFNASVSMREEELSTRMIFCKEGTDADSSFVACRSGAIC